MIKNFSIFKQEGVSSEGWKWNIPSLIALLDELATIFLFLYAVAL